ncbi:hypothetical protein VT98_11842 [Candidatus Electrothrix communis]|uniref:PEGA domain-containing protein n=1 Tax=Candidatus Electrothrix communis TaxID=1859133 RepID=A0A444J4M1_9BACT|nr:hypothetical protein VT98_11842 [Candidatus Electrothrix communis]WLE98500.1 MAG: hypothetical protein QTN59_06595 [Candidatus Electrothrix communis]
MKLFIISVLLVCLLTCFGCDNPLQPSEEKQESQGPQGTTLIHIAPKIHIASKKIKTDNDEKCKEAGFYNQPHYYELYIDDKLVYRDRLSAENEDEDLTKWQLPLGEHQLRVSADGFVSYDKPIEVVKKSNASTTQRFIMALSRDEQAEDKKTESP